MTRATYFVDVILPLAIPNKYTYRVPNGWENELAIGKRAIVQFGKKKLYTSVIANIHQDAPVYYEAKYLEAILDETPIIHKENLALWDWMSSYYMCHLGEVMQAALPNGLKLVSTSKVVLKETEVDYNGLNTKESILIDALSIQNHLEIKEIETILGIKTVYPTIKSLLDKDIIVLAEQVKEKYKPKETAFLTLNKTYHSDKKLSVLLDSLNKAPKQQDALMAFLHEIKNDFSTELKKGLFNKKYPNVTNGITGLVKKDILVESKQEVDRLETYDKPYAENIQLTQKQEESLAEIKNGFSLKKPVLFHGVTGSGKTEVYAKLISETIKKGGKVLYLLPEIALTTQIINRMRKFFGDSVGVYHSRFNDSERVEVWNDTLKENDNRFNIIVGARSAIFLPFQSLDLIIVDEEHDPSYKQYDPAPRYHARDTAIYLAHKWDIPIVLGSATPAIESYYNATQEKYHLVELTERFGNIKMPEILCVDIGDALKKKEMKSHFSSFLLEYIQSYLDNNEQVILFQNRRGYNPLWSCETCGWTPECKNCDVSLTYHKKLHHLKCHYCGFTTKPYKQCMACGSAKLKTVGFGTEKIEDELTLFFPKHTIKRMDLDTTRSKNAYQNILTSFQEGEIDILVGTQMVSKGLDFDNVGMVGVLNADNIIHFPDFRSFERSFQQLTQVAGRAGRKEKRGKVIIQTYSPDHWVIQKVIQNDYYHLFKQELIERRNYKYPPFYRLIKITLYHKDKNTVDQASKVLAQLLKVKLGDRILGPEPPSINRVKNRYINQIIVKFEAKMNSKALKNHIVDRINTLKNKDKFKYIYTVVDVDFH
mgnify:CR=1 FL=1